MKTFKVLLLAAVCFILLGCVSAQTNKRKSKINNKPKTAKTMNDKSIVKPSASEIKILAEAAYSNVETPFIFVARSVETYAQLQTFVENLPSAAEIDFGKTAVVAAFAGEKRTGGFSVAIRRATDKFTVEVVEPPKDAITTDALTTPFQIALVPIEEEISLSLEVSKNWKDAMRIYKISSAEFETSGGFAGRFHRFKAQGAIGVLTFGDYATLVFNLAGTGADKNKKLTEAASGLLKNGVIDLKRLDAGSFSEGPKPPLKISGTIADDKLNLNFEPLPTNFADGFQTRGKIEAVKIN